MSKLRLWDHGNNNEIHWGRKLAAWFCSYWLYSWHTVKCVLYETMLSVSTLLHGPRQMGLMSRSWLSALDYPTEVTCLPLLHDLQLLRWQVSELHHKSPLDSSSWLPHSIWYEELLLISHVTRDSPMTLNPKDSNFSSPWLAAAQYVLFLL